MNHFQAYVFSFIALIILCATSFTSETDDKTQDHEDVMPGHSYQGESFDDGPRQKAYLMGKTGNVRFPITTKAALARTFFEQGIGQLHGFWYFEAERSFRQVAVLDPDCAMAYWGMAMANWENEKRAAGFIQKTRDLLRNTSRREQLYIESMTGYLLGKADKRKRQQTHLDTLKKISTDYPEDIEAKAFYVVRSWQFNPGSQTAALDKILDEIFKVNPLHPAHHYRIHIWDNVNAKNALQSAALCGESAPIIAHMWHMPGHTYDKLKRYPEAAWQQEASSRADHAQMMKDGVLPDQIHNYPHNQEWLIRTLSHIGRVRDAVALAKNMIELPRHPKYNTLAKKNRSAWFGRTRLMELLERYELWDETLKLQNTMYLEPTDFPDEQVRRLRLIGLAQANKKDREKLHETIAHLQKLGAIGKKTETKGKGGPPAAMPQRDNAVKELQFLEALLTNNEKPLLDGVKALRNVSQSRQMRYYFQAGDKAKALELAKQVSASAKNQVAPLAIYVEMLHENGKAKECADAFERLRKISGDIDSLDSPVFKRLEPVAAALKLPADWRIAGKYPSDFGKRPPAGSIGPLRWQPTPAPLWNLPDENGKPIALQSAGKPTLVIFYLGHGCVHCTEQLSKFAAMQKAFASAGISILAVSTDSRTALQQSLSGDPLKKIPFPIASDPKCDVFKQYRAYDDFENQPLHGTFLIDGRGLVRWHDIGYEPFLDTEFILAEARRLLAL